MNHTSLLCVAFLSLALNATDTPRAKAMAPSYQLKKMRMQAKHSARMNKKAAQKLARKHAFSDEDEGNEFRRKLRVWGKKRGLRLANLENFDEKSPSTRESFGALSESVLAVSGFIF